MTETSTKDAMGHSAQAYNLWLATRQNQPCWTALAPSFSWPTISKCYNQKRGSAIAFWRTVPRAHPIQTYISWSRDA